MAIPSIICGTRDCISLIICEEEVVFAAGGGGGNNDNNNGQMMMLDMKGSIWHINEISKWEWT